MVTQVEDQRGRFFELNRARRDVYAFLGRAFLTPPTEESLCALSSDELLAGAEELFGGGVLDSLKSCFKTDDFSDI